MAIYDEKRLKTELKTDARAIGIPSGAADSFIAYTLVSIKKQLKKKGLITNHDLERLVTKELKKYNADLAYVYKNRDKII